jgi:hypothetical protein
MKPAGTNMPESEKPPETENSIGAFPFPVSGIAVVPSRTNEQCLWRFHKLIEIAFGVLKVAPEVP